MATLLHRTTKQYLVSVDPNGLPEPIANYIENPDLAAVVGFGSQYWVITGDVVTLMDAPARAAVDAAALEASRDAVAAEFDQLESRDRAILSLIRDEINVLRALHALPDRTIAQYKSQIRARLGS